MNLHPQLQMVPPTICCSLPLLVNHESQALRGAGGEGLHCMAWPHHIVARYTITSNMQMDLGPEELSSCIRTLNPWRGSQVQTLGTPSRAPPPPIWLLAGEGGGGLR